MLRWRGAISGSGGSGLKRGIISKIYIIQENAPIMQKSPLSPLPNCKCIHCIYPLSLHHYKLHFNSYQSRTTATLFAYCLYCSAFLSVSQAFNPESFICKYNCQIKENQYSYIMLWKTYKYQKMLAPGHCTVQQPCKCTVWCYTSGQNRQKQKTYTV